MYKMSSYARSNLASSGPGGSRRAYITTGAYDQDIYSYTVTFNFPTYSGSLAPLGGAVTVNVAGTILRETGKKLYPGAHAGVSTFMVGVYHPDFGTGFIDPNSPKFAVYNSNKPYYLADGVDPRTGLKDEGQPVYTRGTITAEGAISTDATVTATGNITSTSGNVSATVGNLLAPSGSLVVSEQIRSSTVTALGTVTSSAVINPNLGQVFTFTTNGVTPSITATTPNNLPGAKIHVIVTGDAVGRVVDFNAGFRTLGSGQRTIGNTLASFSFISDGTNFIQIGEAIDLAQ
jgi:hypothetical protein